MKAIHTDGFSLYQIRVAALLPETGRKVRGSDGEAKGIAGSFLHSSGYRGRLNGAAFFHQGLPQIFLRVCSAFKCI